MRIVRTGLIAVLAAISLSGCGTVCNLVGGMVHPDREPRIYGGVIRDVETIEKVVNLAGTPRETQLNGQAVCLLAVAIAVATGDPILSFVADTLTLPITIPLQEKRIAASRTANDDAGGANLANPDSRSDSAEKSAR